MRASSQEEWAAIKTAEFEAMKKRIGGTDGCGGGEPPKGGGRYGRTPSSMEG